MNRTILIIAYSAVLFSSVCLSALSGEKASGPTGTQGDSTTSTPEEIVRELIEGNRLDEAWKLLENIEGNEHSILCFKGIIEIKREHPEKALEYFFFAKKIAPLSSAMHLFAAKAHFSLGNFEETLVALDAGVDVGRKAASYFLFLAQTAQRLGKSVRAYSALQEGARRFPEEKLFLRDTALFFVSLGLFESALSPMTKYLEETTPDLDSFLAAAHTFQKAGRHKQAAMILEDARLRFGEKTEILSRLGYVFGQMGRHFTAARFFERATAAGGAFAFDAAEHFAAAGKLEKALAVNARVTDARMMRSQRLSLYIKLAKYDRARIVGEKMREESRMEDMDLFCLAYAYTELHQTDKVQPLISEIKSAKWRTAALSLNEPEP